LKIIGLIGRSVIFVQLKYGPYPGNKQIKVENNFHEEVGKTRHYTITRSNAGCFVLEIDQSLHIGNAVSTVGLYGTDVSESSW
jgi:hypothetical protein